MSTESIKSVLVAVLDLSKQHILLVKRRDIPMWVLPGGGVDEGESLENAAIREVKEETSLDVEIVRAVASYFPGGPFIKPVRLFAVELKNEQLFQSSLPHSCSEISKIQFFHKNALPKNIPPPFDEFIKEVFQNRPYFERVVSSITRWFIVKNTLVHPILAIRFFLSRLGLHINSNT